MKLKYKATGAGIDHDYMLHMGKLSLFGKAFLCKIVSKQKE